MFKCLAAKLTVLYLRVRHMRVHIKGQGQRTVKSILALCLSVSVCVCVCVCVCVLREVSKRSLAHRALKPLPKLIPLHQHSAVTWHLVSLAALEHTSYKGGGYK